MVAYALLSAECALRSLHAFQTAKPFVVDSLFFLGHTIMVMSAYVSPCHLHFSVVAATFVPLLTMVSTSGESR